MILTDKQLDKWIKWFIETYEKDCTKDENGKRSIPIIYSENPEQTEKEHADMWLEEIKKLMGSNANKKYTHRGGRTETYAKAQFNSLWLYIGPIFKSNKKKDE